MISFERPGFNPETPTTQEVIYLFKSGGPSPEAKAAYSLWYAEKQKEADESNSKYSQLAFNIEICDLLVESGLVEDAYQYLDTTWDMIEGEMSKFSGGVAPDELENMWIALEIVTEKLA